MSSDSVVPKWLDNLFIEQALKVGKRNDKITVRQIEVRPATSEGDNYCSTMFRVTAEYYAPGAYGEECSTESLIVKALPETGDMKNYLIENDSFSTETEVVRNVIPAFHRLLNPSAYDERSVTLAPKCYYHTDKPQKTLVFEDLCQSGFRMVERTLGLDLVHCKLVVSRLGTFHATSVALHRQNPHSFDSFLMYPHLKAVEPTKKILEESFDEVADGLHPWPDMDKMYSEKIRHLGRIAFHRLENAVTRDESSFNVLNHGDAWKNNMMFKYGEDDKVTDLRFVDFQFVYYGSPAIDLLYFLYSSPSSEVRSNHSNELLECYHSSLSETLARLGCDDKCPSLDDIREEIENRGFMMVFTTMCVMPITFADTEHPIDIGGMLDNKTKENSPCQISEGFAQEILTLLPIFQNKSLLD